jgi:hypothetical protein
MSPLYHVVLERDGRPDETRLHDRPLRLGDSFTVLGQAWQVHTVEDGVDSALTEPSGAAVSARYLCRISEL